MAGSALTQTQYIFYINPIYTQYSFTKQLLLNTAIVKLPLEAKCISVPPINASNNHKNISNKSLHSSYKSWLRKRFTQFTVYNRKGKIKAKHTTHREDNNLRPSERYHRTSSESSQSLLKTLGKQCRSP